MTSDASTAQDTGVTVVIPDGGATALNTPCKADSECGAGLICLKSTVDVAGLGGGFPNGVCTLECSGATGLATCGALKGVCVTVTDDNAVTPLAYCLEICTAGTNTASKCHGRLDQSCNSLNTVDACIPLCGEDADCPGRKCDPLSGFCVDKPATGGALGSACTKTKNARGAFARRSPTPRGSVRPSADSQVATASKGAVIAAPRSNRPPPRSGPA